MRQRTMPGGHAVRSPVPELLRTFCWKARSDSVNERSTLPVFSMISTISCLVTRHSSGGSKSAKSTRKTEPRRRRT